MNLNIRGENIVVTPALQDYAEKRIGKLEKYFSEPTTSSARVSMRVHNKDQVVEVTIPMQGLLLRAEESNDDMYTAIDAVAAKLERQIKKFKTRVHRKSRQDAREALIGAVGSAVVAQPSKPETDSEHFDVVRRKSFVLKPMPVEEAVLQMEMLGHTFFVFRDAESSEISVVYRRKDGRYGLIDQG
ncbi:MAG: ribosome-associated translation inhibitor RaiA [Sporolactobacillus sp.]